ncbi:hypothetical protein EV1_012528 [Malus domestica]
MVESVDSNTDPIREKQMDDLLLEQKASQEQFESPKRSLKLEMERFLSSVLSERDPPPCVYVNLTRDMVIT